MITVGENEKCLGCPLRALNPRNTFVGPQVRPGTRVMVGEAPGEEESLQGKPFVGGSGRWVDFFGQKAGFKKDDLNIINTICCRPPNNIYPTDHEAKSYISKEDGRRAVNHCMDHHVWPFLESRKWSRVDLMGAKATEMVAGRKEPISVLRGSPLAIPRLGSDKPIAIPTIHPAAIARDQSMLPVVLNDLRKSLVLSPENYNLHPSLDEVRDFKAKIFALDIETTNWWAGKPKVTMVGLCEKMYTGMCVPFQGPYIAELRRIILDAEEIITQNGLAFDMPILFEALEIEWQQN